VGDTQASGSTPSPAPNTPAAAFREKKGTHVEYFSVSPERPLTIARELSAQFLVVDAASSQLFFLLFDRLLDVALVLWGREEAELLPLFSTRFEFLLQFCDGLPLDEGRKLALTAPKPLVFGLQLGLIAGRKLVSQRLGQAGGRALEALAHLELDVIPHMSRVLDLTRSLLGRRSPLGSREVGQRRLNLRPAHGKRDCAHPVVEGLSQLVHRQFLDGEENERGEVRRHAASVHDPARGLAAHLRIWKAEPRERRKDSLENRMAQVEEGSILLWSEDGAPVLPVEEQIGIEDKRSEVSQSATRSRAAQRVVNQVRPGRRDGLAKADSAPFVGRLEVGAAGRAMA
jgi:hypothetical protein